MSDPVWINIAYVGPGAGFAFVGSFLLLIAAIGLALLALATWPVRALVAFAMRRKRSSRADVRRVVIIGLDGFDPAHYRRLAAKHQLPHLERLERNGAFRELFSTCPPISPVAWSSFTTGTNPGKHRIFDFLGRDPRNMTLELSSARVREDSRGRPVLETRRRSRSFWRILGEHGVFCHVFRVPLTFPPEPFYGLMLSGLGVPDLRGTQGTFTLLADGPSAHGHVTGGLRLRVQREGENVVARLPGPAVTRGGKRVILEASMRLSKITPDSALLRISGARLASGNSAATNARGRREDVFVLPKGQYTPWIRVPFVGARRRIYGLCRFCLLQTEPEFQLYATPLNLDPEHPSFPISHPAYYSIYLAKRHGAFATLGLAEDTWALNERVLSESLFLRQTYDIHEEREQIFLEILEQARAGLVVGVFEASDRVQHMFPPNPEKESARELDEVYARMDDWVGRVMDRLDARRDVLLVVSDHGFTTFRRGVNLNAWLRDQGYLKPAARQEEGYLRGIDWTATCAYAFGLAGIYVNREGREAHGIVPPTEVDSLKQEIAERLRALVDPETGAKVVREVYDTRKIYSGPYCDEGPDLVVGFERGYRVSWDGVIGRIEPTVFSDNTKHWQGDHCVDYSLVPGVLFCNRTISTEGPVRLVDIAPSILRAFGVEPPSYMDGRAFEIGVSVPASEPRLQKRQGALS